MSGKSGKESNGRNVFYFGSTQGLQRAHALSAQNNSIQFNSKSKFQSIQKLFNFSIQISNQNQSSSRSQLNDIFQF